VTHDQHGRPFELAKAIYRADRYRIRATLTASPASRLAP
jgi:DNA-binding GntR family transcriptional regulator